MKGEVIISYNVVSLSLPRSALVLYFHTHLKLTISTLCVFCVGFVMQVKITPISSWMCACQPMGRLICCPLAKPVSQRRWLSADFVPLQMKLLCRQLGRGVAPLSSTFACFWDWPRVAATQPPFSGIIHTLSSEREQPPPRPRLPWSLVKSVL